MSCGRVGSTKAAPSIHGISIHGEEDMFFSVFWTGYIPIVTIILAAVGNWAINGFRWLRARARLVCSSRDARRTADAGRTPESMTTAPVVQPASLCRQPRGR